jgi:hypothetical protein
VRLLIFVQIKPSFSKNINIKPVLVATIIAAKIINSALIRKNPISIILIVKLPKGWQVKN